MLLERILLFGICSIAVPLGACASSAESRAAAPEPAIEAPDMNALWAAHAAHRQRGDLDAAIGILAEDCVLFEPFQPPVSGLENIAPKMKEALAQVKTHHVSFESQEVFHHGGWLVDFGTFSETFSLAGEEDRHAVEGNYAAVLEQEADGEWRVKRFMALPSKAPELLGETPPGTSAR